MRINQIIEEAKIETALETSNLRNVGAASAGATPGADALFCQSGPGKPLMKAWNLKRSNKIFLRLLEKEGGEPTATYRVSFTFPLKRITSWVYRVENFQLRPKKIKLLEFFVLLAKLKGLLESGELIPKQLLFSLNQFRLTDNPLYVIDCVLIIYQQRRIEAAAEYAGQRAAKRKAHKLMNPALILAKDLEMFQSVDPSLGPEREPQAREGTAAQRRARKGIEDGAAILTPRPKDGGDDLNRVNDDDFMDKFVQKSRDEIAERQELEAQEAAQEELNAIELSASTSENVEKE